MKYRPLITHIGKLKFHILEILIKYKGSSFSIFELNSELYKRKVKTYFYEYVKEGGTIYAKSEDCIIQALDLLNADNEIKLSYISEKMFHGSVTTLQATLK